MRQVALLVFDGVEVLDFAGPFEVFSVAVDADGAALFKVRLVAASADPVTAVNGLRVLPDLQLDQVPDAAVLVIPGGVGSRAAVRDGLVVDWVRQAAATAEIVLGVCTGARLLAAAGLLDGRRFTTHHQAWDELAATPGATLVRGQRHVEDGRLVTAAGISAGIDAALRVVARLAGQRVAAATARYMEYHWPSIEPGPAGLALRYAGPADTEAIVALAQSAYRGEDSRAGWTTEADLLDGQRTDADAVAAMLDGGQAILLAERDGALVGCCHLHKDGDDCWFGLFAVPPGLQGQGLGDALLACAERRAYRDFDAHRLRMKVIWLRESLIDWYRRRGYSVSADVYPFPYGEERFGRPRRDDLHFLVLDKVLD